MVLDVQGAVQVTDNGRTSPLQLLARLAPETRIELPPQSRASLTLYGNRSVYRLTGPATVDVTKDADWTNYRDFWRQQTGRALRAVRYRGEGQVAADPDSPRRISVAIRIEVAESGEQIDGGNLSGTVGPAGRRIEARFWINSEQAERAVVLRRER